MNGNFKVPFSRLFGIDRLGSIKMSQKCWSSKKKNLKLGMVTNTFNLSTLRRKSQAVLCEFEASMIYITSSRTDRTT